MSGYIQGQGRTEQGLFVKHDPHFHLPRGDPLPTDTTGRKLVDLVRKDADKKANLSNDVKYKQQRFWKSLSKRYVRTST